MSYANSWTHQDGAGHVAAGDWASAIDVNELQDAINRRLKLMFDPGDDWPLDFEVSAGDWVAASAIGSARDGLESLVPASDAWFAYAGGWGQLSGLAWWLYPESGADEDKFIVADGKPPGSGEVGFFAKLNGGSGWTGSPAGGFVKAIHVNEPRDAAGLLRRGRYLLRVGDGGGAKASKALPGGLWYPPAVARDDGDEMHCWFGGREWLYPSDGAGGYRGTRGQSVTVRSGSWIRLKPVGDDVKVRLYHCKRNVNTSSFSWTEYDSDASLSWGAAGGTGAADATHLADFELTDGDWTEHTDGTLISLLQQMADGDVEPTFMLTPDEETGWGDDPTHIEVELRLDFDLDGPPV